MHFTRLIFAEVQACCPFLTWSALQDTCFYTHIYRDVLDYTEELFQDVNNEKLLWCCVVAFIVVVGIVVVGGGDGGDGAYLCCLTYVRNFSHSTSIHTSKRPLLFSPCMNEQTFDHT